MRMRHSDKVKMAKKMLTREERRKGIGIFQSEAWDFRKGDIFEREVKRMKNSRNNKLKKK